MSKINIYDVAKAAGVHRSTVSRALTGSGPVSADKKERVLEAAKRLNYHANSVAGALKSKRRSTWGFLSFWISTPNSSDAFYAKTLGGLLDAANHVSYRLLLMNVVGRFDENPECVRFCHDAQLGGLVVLAPRTHQDSLGELKRLSVPVVLLAYRPQDPEMSFVDLDNVKGAAMATAHLVQRGRRRIAFIGGDRELNTNAEDRYQGYLQGLAAAGLREQAELVYHGNFDPAFAVEAARSLLKDPATRPDGVFCATDSMAAALIHTAGEFGLRVPQDLSVVGFDDNADVQVPGGLTTIRYPFFEAAQKAGESLSRLSADPSCGPLRLLLEPGLIVRGST